MKTEIELVRERVLELLGDEKRAMHTGEIAARLGVPTHLVHTAMHHALQRGIAWFHSSEGYSVPLQDAPPAGSCGGQMDLATREGAGDA